MTTPVLLRDLPPVIRPRERLLQLGASALKNSELLALVLRTGYRGHGVLSVAEALLDRHALPDLLALSAQELARLPGIGPSRAAALLAGAELAQRARQGSPEFGDLAAPSALGRETEAPPTIRSVSEVVALAGDIRARKKEYLLAFFLNARHQLIKRETISIGTLTASLAHPREVFAPAIGQAAAGVILVHNHPSGDPEPSDEDRRLTQRVAQAGRILGIELLDHLIVAETGCYSFKVSGGL